MIKIIKAFDTKPVDFYVYLHRRLDTMGVFYVGKGSKDRAWMVSSRSRDKNSHWGNVAKKHGIYIEIVKDKLQEWYALELEIELIALYGRSDSKSGKLVNKTDGGESGLGIIFTEATRLKLKECQLKYGKRVTLNNHISFLTIKDAARYLLGDGKTDLEYRRVCSAVSSCLCGRSKTYKGNLLYQPHNDYAMVLKESENYLKAKHSDEVMIQAYNEYMSNKKTIVILSKELGLAEGYLQNLFKGVYRPHLNFKQKSHEDSLRFNNSEIIASLDHLTAIQAMKIYNISKTHLYRIKRSVGQ